MIGFVSKKKLPAFESEQTETLYPYMIFFSHHEGKEWICHAGCIWAQNKESIESLLKRHYGEVLLRSAEKIDIQEGTILYGERWKTLNG